MHVVLHCLSCRFLRRLEQRPHVDFEAQVGERGGDDLRAAIVAVLAQFHHQHSRTAPTFRRKRLDFALYFRESFVALVGGTVNARHGMHHRPVTRPDLLQRVGDLADRGAAARRLYGEPEQVLIAAAGCGGQRFQRGLARGVVPPGADVPDAPDLGLADGGVVDTADLDVVGGVRLVTVDPDHHVLAAVEPRLTPRRRFFDADLRHAFRHCLGHAAHFLHLVDQRSGCLTQAGGQMLQVIGPGQRIHYPADSRLFTQDQLRVARDAGGRVGR